MRFKIDENLPVEVALLIRREGHDAKTVIDQRMSGAPDKDLAQTCIAERRIVITLDTGFADMRAFPPGKHPGIIVLRLGSQSVPHVLAVFGSVLEKLESEPLAGSLWVVEETRIRIR